MSAVKYFAQITISLALFTGCSSSGTHPLGSRDGKLYSVTADNAAFFRHGPQQGGGPDRTLPRNTLVRLIRGSWGYSKVQIVEDNQQGYISSDEIATAPASLLAAATSTPIPEATPEQFELNSSDPQLNASQEALPAPDLPAPTDVPPAAQPSPADQ